MALDPRAWLAELIATFTLVFFGTISVTVSTVVFNFDSPVASLFVIAFAHGLAIMLMIYSLGHISGAHINPAVTVPMTILRKVSVGNGIFYVIFQLIGATLASAAHAAILPQGKTVNWGLHQPGKAIGSSDGVALMVEIILTFFLLFVIFGTAVSPKGPSSWAGFAIGMTVTMDHLVGVPLTGASMNPARSFGPALISGIWTSHWVYWIGPLVGGMIGALVYQYIFIGRQTAREIQPKKS